MINIKKSFRNYITFWHGVVLPVKVTSLGHIDLLEIFHDVSP